MPQEHHVLRCFSCETFQVHIVKKSKKWECKICGSKQSMKRNYGRGSGKDCRNQVMKLNEQRVLKDNTFRAVENHETSEEKYSDNLRESEEKKPFLSKWTEYLEDECNNEGNESEEDDTPFCLSEICEKKKKRVRKMPGKSYSNKKICKADENDKLAPESCDEYNYLFSTVEKETSERNAKVRLENQKKCFAATAAKKDNSMKFPVEPKFSLKQSKYAKYLDEEEESKHETEIKTDSNISGSDLFDLDDILNF